MTHPIPAAIDYIYGKLRGQLESDSFQVLDGPPIVEMSNNGVAIGYAPERLAVEVERTTEGPRAGSLAGGGLGGGLGGDDGIRFDINCITWVRSGNTNMKAIRDACYEQLATVDSFLKGDRRLGGIVTRVSMRLVDYDQLQAQEGSWGTAAFTITCDAYTS